MVAAPKQEKPVDLRRPRIPRAAPLPKIPGPRGGPAYRPHPNDQKPQNDNHRAIAGPYASAELADPLYMQSIMPLSLVCGFAAFCSYLLAMF